MSTWSSYYFRHFHDFLDSLIDFFIFILLTTSFRFQFFINLPKSSIQNLINWIPEIHAMQLNIFTCTWFHFVNSTDRLDSWDETLNFHKPGSMCLCLYQSNSIATLLWLHLTYYYYFTIDSLHWLLFDSVQQYFLHLHFPQLFIDFHSLDCRLRMTENGFSISCTQMKKEIGKIIRVWSLLLQPIYSSQNFSPVVHTTVDDF